jgi:hypothetical protein
MAEDSKGAKRDRAESRFKKAQTTDQEARGLIEAERAAIRKKTERLKSLRLAQEADAGKTEIDKKSPASKTRKPKARA